MLTGLFLEELLNVLAVNVDKKLGDHQAREDKRAGESGHADRCKEFDVIEY